MAGAFIQGTGTSGASSASGLAQSFGSTTTTGSLILVYCVTNGVGTPTISVADNKGNTYSPLTAASDSGHTTRCQWFYCKNAAGGASHQVTMTPSGTAFRSIAVAEFSGEDTTGTQDGQAIGGPTTGANAATGSITVTGGNTDTLVGGMTHNDALLTLSPGAGFSQIAEVESVTNMPFNAEYKLGVTASQTATWTHASATGWLAAGASFAEAVAAAATTADPFAGSIRVPNNQVGPPVLRLGRHSPVPYDLTLAPPAYDYFAPLARVPNNRVGPMALRALYRPAIYPFAPSAVASTANRLRRVICAGA